MRHVQMADTPQVITQMNRQTGVSYPVLVPNAKGLDSLFSLLDKDASSSGAAPTDEIAIFTAATESFTKANTNCTISESLDRLSRVTSQALSRGLKVRGYISVVAGCPYEGKVDPKVVGQVAKSLKEMGCYEVSLGDTIGKGTPGAMLDVLNECTKHMDVKMIAAHCHDTFGTGLANVLAMVRVSAEKNPGNARGPSCLPVASFPLSTFALAGWCPNRRQLRRRSRRLSLLTR